jgi:hypothetical protein
LLGTTARITGAALGYKNGFEVDLYGSATLNNDAGLTAQVSFGMDNSYRCSLDVWGNNGTIFTNRVFTAPADYMPIIITNIANQQFERKLQNCDCFLLSIEKFFGCISNTTTRITEYNEITKQAIYMNRFAELAE